MRDDNTRTNSTYTDRGSRSLRRASVGALIGVLGLAGIAAGCGGDDGGSSQGVATIDQQADDDGGGGSQPEGSAGSTPENFEDAMAEYTSCMQDEGIDMSQPMFVGDDGAVVAAAGPDRGDGRKEAEMSADEIDELVNDEDYQAAQKKCEPLMEGAFQDFEMDPEQAAERQDQMLEWAQCMRDRGHDVPDPTFSDDGMSAVESEEAEAGATPIEDEQFVEDTEACHEEVGMMTEGDMGVHGNSSSGSGEGGATGE